MTMRRLPSSRHTLEDEFLITKFRRFLPDRGRKGHGLIQFWAKEGGMRTMDVDDVIEVR